MQKITREGKIEINRDRGSYREFKEAMRDRVMKVPRTESTLMIALHLVLYVPTQSYFYCALSISILATNINAVIWVLVMEEIAILFQILRCNFCERWLLAYIDMRFNASERTKVNEIS